MEKNHETINSSNTVLLTTWESFEFLPRVYIFMHYHAQTLTPYIVIISNYCLLWYYCFCLINSNVINEH